MIRALVLLLFLALPARADDLAALTRLDVGRSGLAAQADGIDLRLGLGQPVPWRVRVLDDPPRLIVDTREVDWRGLSSLARPEGLGELRAGPMRPGWSRLVMELPGPMRVAEAGMTTTAGAVGIVLRLVPTTADHFAVAAARPDPPAWTLPDALPTPRPRTNGGPLVVVLDPGHGGIDPGAERDGLTEANLMLTFARELKEHLLRTGGFRVELTRDDDIFVPLETRISLARAAGADVLLSLHADALAEGRATGATLYTLSEEGSDRAAAALAERHDRDDLLSGVDLTGLDDLVAQVLMDMARTETAPRVDRLAVALEAGIKGAGLVMHRRPRQSGAFSVLKSPDIPSILLELGFMSSQRDLDRMTDPAWRARMAGAIGAALAAWAEEDTRLRAARQ